MTGPLEGSVASQRSELTVEFVSNHTRFDGHRIGVDRENVVEVPGEVDDDARSQASAGHAASGSPWKHPDVGFGRVVDNGDDIVPRPRAGDGQRLDLVEARVAGVESRREWVDEQFAVEHTAQVLDHPLALLFHA